MSSEFWDARSNALVEAIQCSSQMGSAEALEATASIAWFSKSQYVDPSGLAC